MTPAARDDITFERPSVGSIAIFLARIAIERCRVFIRREAERPLGKQECFCDMMKLRIRDAGLCKISLCLFS
jgi:hypothetical protein